MRRRKQNNEDHGKDKKFRFRRVYIIIPKQ